MKSPMTAIVGILLIFFIIMFGIQYGVLAIGSTTDGVNMTENPYETQYNAGQNTSIVGVSLIQSSPMFIGLLILIVSLVALMKSKL